MSCEIHEGMGLNGDCSFEEVCLVRKVKNCRMGNIIKTLQVESDVEYRTDDDISQSKVLASLESKNNIIISSK